MPGDFYDSNIFVYLFDDQDQRKRGIARTLVDHGLENGAAISHQVVQETLNVITTKLLVPVRQPDARQFLGRVLGPMWKVSPTVELFDRALRIQERYMFAFYDSLIVAAALEAGCSRLLSEDFQHGQRIDTLVIEDPFRS